MTAAFTAYTTNLDASSVVSLDDSELLDPASLTDGPMSTGLLGWVLGLVLINNGPRVGIVLSRRLNYSGPSRIELADDRAAIILWAEEPYWPIGADNVIVDRKRDSELQRVSLAFVMLRATCQISTWLLLNTLDKTFINGG